MSFYSNYCLRDNPFPTTPVLEPSDSDIRINGTIYNPEIMAEEMGSLCTKIRRRPPLIYIENSDFVRDVGKSALIVQQWRQLQEDPTLTSIYLRSEKKHSPADFAARLISRWDHEGYLWTVLLRLLSAYVGSGPQGEITVAGAAAFCNAFRSLPHRALSLRDFMVYNPDRLISDLAVWTHRQEGDGLPLEIAQTFYRSYLTDPRTFSEEYQKTLRKHRWDHITMIAAVYRLLRLGGYAYHYLFCDQFEDVVHGLSGKSLITFNTEMRRLIEASINRSTMIVSLHPGAHATLDTAEGGDITSIAPLDQRHVVTVWPLGKEEAGLLARTYLDCFRVPSSPPPDPLYPFNLDAIEEIWATYKGNIRACLLAFNYAVEKGVDEGYPPIDGGFLVKHHADITGQVHADDVILKEGF